MRAVTMWKKAHYEWILHSQPLQQGWAGSMWSLIPPGPSSALKPQWFPSFITSTARLISLCTLAHFSQKWNHILFFRRKHMLRGKIIKNFNWIKVWSLLLWTDPEVTLWDWSQGLQLFHLSLVVKEHRIWPVIYWEMHHWWWFLSLWILCLENNCLLYLEQVWKSEVYRWHIHNHRRFI